MTLNNGGREYRITADVILIKNNSTSKGCGV